MDDKTARLLSKWQSKAQVAEEENIRLKSRLFDLLHPEIKDVESSDFKSQFVDTMMKLQRAKRDEDRLKALFEDTKTELVETRVKCAKLQAEVDFHTRGNK